MQAINVAYNAAEDATPTGYTTGTAKQSNGTNLPTIVAATSAGDAVAIGAGTFAVGATRIAAAGREIVGAGIAATIITDAAGVAMSATVSAVPTIIRDLMLDTTPAAPSSCDPLNVSGSQNMLILKNLHVKGLIDAFHSTSALAGDILIVDCAFESNYDSFEIHGALAPRLAIHNSTFTSTGSAGISTTVRGFAIDSSNGGVFKLSAATITGTSTLAQPTPTAGDLTDGNDITCGIFLDNNSGNTACDLVLYNPTISATDTVGTATFGFAITGNCNANVTIYGGTTTTSNNGHTDFSIYHAGSGILTLVGHTYDNTKVRVVGTGSIIDLTAGTIVTSAGTSKIGATLLAALNATACLTERLASCPLSQAVLPGLANGTAAVTVVDNSPGLGI